MRINNRFGLALTLVVATAIAAVPARADTTTTPSAPSVAQPVKGKKVIPAQTQVNPKLNEKIKVIQPGGGIQGKEGDFKDKGQPFAETPKFGEGKPVFVNFNKDKPGSQQVNPAEKITPSAVQKMQKIQTNGR